MNNRQKIMSWRRPMMTISANFGRGGNVLLLVLLVVLAALPSAVLGEDEGSPAPSFATPQPITPEPTTPAPIATTPAPITPQPVTPQPVTPQPVTPQPVTPQPVTPQPVTPAPITPQPVTPQPVTPPPVTPQPVTPQPVTPQPVTQSPSDSPTDALTPSPSVQPSDSPTGSPTNFPSSSPTDQPSGTPSNQPTLAPAITDRPSTAPVITTAPSLAPSGVPSKDPTSQPSLNPTTTSPSTFPSGTPTKAPIVGTASPSISSSPTTTAPTIQPSDEPTLTPSTTPTEIPSEMPIVGTKEPSVSPSLEPTSPSPEPTKSPGDGKSVTVTNLRMDLVGPNKNDMNEESESEFQTITEDFVAMYFLDNQEFNIDIIETTIIVTDILDGSSRRRNNRGLQGSSVTMVYTQDITYQSSDPSVTDEFLTTEPFADEASRQEYATLLADSEAPGLIDVESVSTVDFPATTESPSVTPQKTDGPTEDPGKGDDGGGLSTGAIIGIACGGGVLLLGCLAYNFCNTGDKGDGDLIDPNEQVDTYVVPEAGPDEISTLGPPQGLEASNMRYGGGFENQSVGTHDPIYSDAYASGGASMVSSVGGTLGSNTHGLSTTLDPNSAARSAALGASGLSDGDAFNGQYGSGSSNVREEVMDVMAPPGKLGVVIDTPDDGAPVVHAVKDSSVIAHLVQVGDLLVAVDDEDVREMSAIKVSKLISRKSANPTRKLTIVRKTVVG